MTADDLTRRAIIAAHEEECACNDVSTCLEMTAREEAIVALWRADREDYQGRYETSHDSRMHAESRLEDMTREARLSREVTGKAVARAKRAVAAIERAEAEQKERMDAAHEQAKAERERCGYVGGRDDTRCLLDVGHDGTHYFGAKAGGGA